MKQNRSFSDYIFDRFYNDIFNRTKTFIIQNRCSLDLRSYVVQQIKYVDLEDISVVNVSVDDCPKQKITFDVTVDAEIAIFGYDQYNDYKNDVVNQWFTLSCSGDLSCSLDDFEVNDISVYNKKKHHENLLSDALVPYIYSKELENYATEFLKSNYPEALNTPMFLDPIKLANNMNLDVQLEAVPEEEWVRVPDTHEAIIPHETFDKVQSLLIRDTRTSPKGREVHLFSGFLKCADCGRSLSPAA